MSIRSHRTLPPNTLERESCAVDSVSSHVEMTLRQGIAVGNSNLQGANWWSGEGCDASSSFGFDGRSISDLDVTEGSLRNTKPLCAGCTTMLLLHFMRYIATPTCTESDV